MRRFAIAPIPLRYARGAPLRRSHLYHVAQPLDPVAIEGIQQNGVKSAGWSVRKSREIKTRRCDHPCALRCCNACSCPAEIAPLAEPYFDEYQHVAIASDEVDLTHAAAPVALDDDKALANEEFGGKRLRRCTLARAQRQGEPAGTIRPPLN